VVACHRVAAHRAGQRPAGAVLVYRDAVRRVLDVVAGIVSVVCDYRTGLSPPAAGNSETVLLSVLLEN